MSMTLVEHDRLRAKLHGELAAALGLKELRTGREKLRDESGVKVAERRILSAWSVIVEPSFSAWIAAAATHGDDGQTRAVVLLEQGEAPARRVGPVTLQTSQEVVLCALNDVRLVEPVEGIALDGTGYTWTVLTGAMKATVSFSNPRTPSLEQLESRLMEFVRLVVETAGADAGDPIIGGWVEHVEKFAKR